MMYAPASSSLTPNAIEIMYEMDSSMDDEFFAPVVQVLRLKKLNDGDSDGEGDKWAVALSDGEHFVHGECAPEPLNKMIYNHIIAQNAFITLDQFVMYTKGDRKICYILDAHQAAPNPGTYIGSPIDIRLFLEQLRLNPEGEKIKATRQRQGMMVKSMDAAWKQKKKGRSNDTFFAARSEPKWQNAYRDFHNRQDVVEKVESILEGAETTQRRKISSHRKGELLILAQQWELKMYEQADSFETYSDASTFTKRMNKLSRSTNSEGEITLMQHHRLHLLRHAMTCRESACTVSPFCRDMKDVVKHIERCRDREQCEVPFCVTFQRLIYHSKCCREPNCKICNPSISLPDCPLCEEEGKKQQQQQNRGAVIQGQSFDPTKLRQDYLLTMLHASTCHHNNEAECLSNPLCFDLKKVWIHKTYCTDVSCEYPFCASSRPIFDHYNSCYGNTCQLCPPVRATKAKHGIGKLTVDVDLQVCMPVGGLKPVNSSNTVQPAQEAQSVSPPSAVNPPREPPVADACPSVDTNMVAQQEAIYKEIQQKQNRKRSLVPSTTQNPVEDPFDAYMAGAPVCDMDSVMEDFSTSGVAEESVSSCSLSKTSSKPVTNDDLQVREYERLARDHKQRQQSGSCGGSNSGGSNSSVGSKGREKPASSSACEEDKKLPPKSGGSKNFNYGGETNYRGTRHRTESGTKPVKCMHCHLDLFVNPIATQVFCQECNSISFIGVSLSY